MFNTRSGFWLLASIVISALLATAGVIVWAPSDQLTYATFATAIRFPVVVILPLIAILAVTGEWSQRTGLTTFTLVPQRSRIITAKAISSVLIAVAAMVLTFAVGALGNLASAAVTNTALVWDVTPTQCLYYVLGMVLSLLIGFMLGVLIRSSTGAIVAYFVLTFVLPTILGLLATSQRWFHDLRPWVDIQFAQSGLLRLRPGTYRRAVDPGRRHRCHLAGRAAGNRTAPRHARRGQVTLRPTTRLTILEKGNRHEPRRLRQDAHHARDRSGAIRLGRRPTTESHRAASDRRQRGPRPRPAPPVSTEVPGT